MFNPKSAWAHDLQTMYSGYVGTLKAQFNALPLGCRGGRRPGTEIQPDPARL